MSDSKVSKVDGNLETQNIWANALPWNSIVYESSVAQDELERSNTKTQSNRQIRAAMRRRAVVNGLDRIYDYFQRALALVALIILSPLFILLAVLIKLDSKGPIFFIQNRAGRNNKLFGIYKFRTMKVDTPSEVPTRQLDEGKGYITRIGRFLRKTSVDELPQLINIVKGDMLFVGPRPVLACEDDLIKRRTEYGVHVLKPGITGWAQINGRDEVLVEDKVSLDYNYLLHRSVFVDIKILLKTVPKVIRHDGFREGRG